jgi:hypothetical protein
MKTGWKAFVRRFIDRFPESDYRYVIASAEKEDSVPLILNSLENATFDGDRQWLTIFDRKTDTELAYLVCRLTFGIQLRVISVYLKDNLHLYLRPPKLLSGTHHHRRQFLKPKPKFAKLGASLASQIYFQFAEACLSCRKIKRQHEDGLCKVCHQSSVEVANVLEAGRG